MSTTPTVAPSSAELHQLRKTVQAGLDRCAAEPDLRQGLAAALACLERRLGLPRSHPKRASRRPQ